MHSEEELVSRAIELRPLLERNAARTEAARRVVEENMRALEAAGLMDLILPRRLGGQGASMETMLKVSAELGKGCPSTAWVQTLMNVSAWFATRASPEAQEEIFADGARPRLCGSLAPTCTMRMVEGGALVSGRWDFTSSCWHSNWCICGIPALESDARTDESGWAFIPMSQLTIEDTWHAAGMKGTGSATVVAHEVFVSSHRLMSLRGEHVDENWRSRRNLEQCDFWPLKTVLVLVLIGPVLGAAEAVLEAVAPATQQRGIKYTVYTRRSLSPVVQRDFAAAALKLDTARFHVLRAAADVDRAGAGAQMDGLTRARVRGDCGYAAEMARDAVEVLVSIAGGTAFPESNRIQRHWRDVGVASRQSALITATDLEIYGRALLGVESNITTVV
jgi:3-hydroxy-9,10-secoandrosta-1,3,5(10)-triene-9,17-dione monooxygenase